MKSNKYWLLVISDYIELKCYIFSTSNAKCLNIHYGSKSLRVPCDLASSAFLALYCCVLDQSVYIRPVTAIGRSDIFQYILTMSKHFSNILFLLSIDPEKGKNHLISCLRRSKLFFEDFFTFFLCKKLINDLFAKGNARYF